MSAAGRFAVSMAGYVRSPLDRPAGKVGRVSGSGGVPGGLGGASSRTWKGCTARPASPRTRRWWPSRCCCYSSELIRAGITSAQPHDSTQIDALLSQDLCRLKAASRLRWGRYVGLARNTLHLHCRGAQS